MSEYSEPSGFLQQGDFQLGNGLDDSVDINGFDPANFNLEFDNASYGHPQAGLSYGEHQSRYEPNEIVEAQGEVSSLQNPIPDNDSSSYRQRQGGLTSVSQHHLFEPNELGEGQERITQLPDMNPASDTSNFGQQQVGLTSGDDEQQFQFQSDVFSSEEWKNSEAHAANGDFSDFPDTVAQDEHQTKKDDHKHTSPIYHTPIPQGDFDTYAASSHSLSVENGERSVVNTSGIDSAYGTLNPSPQSTSGLSLGTPYQTESTVQQYGSGNTHGLEASMYSSQQPNTYHEGAEEADTEVTENDPKFNPADDLNYYRIDLDTGVIESRRRRGWGRTGTRNGAEVWFNPETEQWQESASHHSYREILIARAQAEHPDQEYLHPDPTDGLPHSETAFFLPHQNLGPNRDDCPDECFVWPKDKPEGDPDDKEAGDKGQAKKKRKPNPRPNPGFWFEDNKILLDPHNNPVKKHLDMPLTLSAETEGYKLQVMRLRNTSISQKDEWARMPRWIRKKKPKTYDLITKYIGSPNTHVNMPSQRFRDEKGTVAGNIRQGTDKIREGLKAFFAENGFDPSLTGSTRGFARDLFPWEQDSVKLGNTGKHGMRAGESRALDEETRNKNLQKTLRRIEKGKEKAEAGKASSAFGKRPREDDDGYDHDSNPAQRKSKSGGRSRNGHRKPASSQPQRYGTFGAAPTPYQNTSTLEAGGRSYSGTYGTAPSPYQNINVSTGNQQAHSLGNNHFAENQRVPYYQGIGLETDTRLDQLQQECRGQMWSAQGSIGQNNYRGLQYQPQHNASPDYTYNIQDGPPVQHQGFINGTNGAPKHEGDTLGQGGRRLYQAPNQILGRRGREDSDEVDQNIYTREKEAAGVGRSARNAQYGYVESGNPVIQNQTQEERGAEISPSEQQQVGQLQDMGYQAGQFESSVQADRDSENGAPSKRQRKDENPGIAPGPQRRAQNERTPRRRYYGAAGAPVPLLSLEEPFGTSQPVSDFNEDTEGPLKSPEELFRTMPDLLGSYGDAAARTFSSTDQGFYDRPAADIGPSNPLNGDVYGGPILVAASNESVDQSMTDAPSRHSKYLERLSEGHLPEQILGKHRREDHVGEWEQDAYVPEQDSGEQEPQEQESNWDEHTSEPKPKRRDLTATESYYSPPAQNPKAATVQKEREAEWDARLPPPQLHTNENIPDVSQAPVEDAHLTPAQHIYINGTVINFDEAPQVADARGLDPPQAPPPAQAEPGAPSDFRDVRPVNGWQSQSLDRALRYTREAYREWTGEAAPVTNLEDTYNVQYREIRAAFRVWWKSERDPQRLDPLPELFRMKAWGGAVENWRVPENRSISVRR